MLSHQFVLVLSRAADPRNTGRDEGRWNSGRVRMGSGGGKGFEDIAGLLMKVCL